MYIAEKLAEFALDLNYDSLSPASVHQVTMCTLDLIGVAIGGASSPWSQIIADFVLSQKGKEESTIIRHGQKTTCTDAAFVNGTMAHSLEFDDTGGAGGHPGGVVIPASLSTAEKMHGSGKDFIASVIVGYEVMDRILRAVDPIPKGGHEKRGFHATATSGCFAAAAAAGKMLGLTEKQMVNAFGIAGSYASGLREFISDGSMTKRFHSGKAAQSGIASALLSQHGFTGPRSIFEGNNGFLRAFSNSPEPHNAIENLGEEFAIMKTIFKKFTCCAALQSAMEAAINIAQNHSVNPEDIEKISVKVREIFKEVAESHRLETMLDAQMSLPYAVAVAIVTGRGGIEEFSDAWIKDPLVIQLSRKVNPIYDSDYDKKTAKAGMRYPSVVEIQTKTRHYLKEVLAPKGDPRNPMTQQEIEAKFRSLSEPGLGHEKTIRIINMVRRLDRVTDMNELAEFLH